MAWGWISALLASHPYRMGGLFAYLAIRDDNRTRLKLEDVRREATNDLIDHLPRGAVYRETTRDCRREIWMPSQSQYPILLLPEVHHEPENDRFDPTELPVTLREIRPEPTAPIRGVNRTSS